jgi:hypothetical protein
VVQEVPALNNKLEKMVFRQDFKKIYVRALFLFGTFGTFIVYGIWFNTITFGFQDLLFLIFIVLFPTLWCLSYYWYYLKTTDTELIKVIFGKVKSIPIEDITELSYENNPARPLVYITFNTPTGREDYIEFTTGVWSPHTLHTLNAELQRRNLNIEVKFDEKTKKHFEKDKDYHLHHPTGVFGWVLLGIRQISVGVVTSIILIAILKYL